MFKFIIDQELCARKLMDRIMYCGHFLDQKDILKFIYCFMIIFLTLYIFKYFLLLVSFSHQGSAIIFLFLILIIFYLNWNQHVKYKIF
jgi:hypothetical protein